MASHAVRKAANALAEEGELLNVHAELKDVANAFDKRIKLQERASRTISRWTEKKHEDIRIQELLGEVGIIEGEMGTTDKLYNEDYRAFVRLWKDVLAEKKELNTKTEAFRKAQRNLESAQKKLQQAEAKQEHDKTLKARKQLESVQQGYVEVKAAMEVKLLEVQQDKHEKLRSGYMSLYRAQMHRMHELTQHLDKLRVLLNEFPSVKDRNEDGWFEFEPWEGPFEPQPSWCQGDELAEKLSAVESKHRKELEELHGQHTSSLDDIVRERDEMEAQKNESYSAEVVAMMAKNKALTEQLQASHKRALKAAEEKREAMQSEFDKRVTQYENKLKQAAQQLKTRQAEIIAQISEISRLEESAHGFKLTAAQLAIQQGIDSISAAADALPQSAAAFFMVEAKQLREVMTQLTLELQGEDNHVSFSNAAAAFSSCCTRVMLGAWALVKSSKAEMAGSLLHAVTTFHTSAAALVQAARQSAPAKRKPTLSRAATMEELPSIRLLQAMYDHAPAGEQAGRLVAFSKGDTMLLIKEREDGWCKVKLTASGTEGWAPRSYLEDAPRDEDEGEADESIDSKTVEALEAEVAGALDKMLEVAAQVVERDQELASNANILADDIQRKVSAAEQSVLDALSHIAKLRQESESSDTGRRLEVNTNLLNLAEKLATILRELMKTAKAVRSALERTRGMVTVEEFNKKHEGWFHGLTQAVDVMFEGLPLLTEALRSVVRKQGKHEELQVGARNLSASVAQLAALTRTKTLPDNDSSQAQLNVLAEEFKSNVHALLAASRECNELDLASVLLEDYGNLSETEAKRLVMSTQVNVLRMESQLEKEHEKLRRLRRLVNYADGEEDTS